MSEWNKTDPLQMEEARQLVLERVQEAVCAEETSIYAAAGRVAAEDCVATFDSPPFDRSPLDGYAFSHTALEGAPTPEHPAVLPVCMKLYAGDAASRPVPPGAAARIMTGAPIPPGADCVVRQEDTDGGEETVRVYCGARAGENICRAGEDVKKGAPLVARGEVLSPAAVALLAAQGYGCVRVRRRVRVGVLSTGSELVPPGAAALPPQGGKIFDSNGPMVCARLAQLGLESVPGTGADDEAALAAHLAALLETCDAAVTTGGVSVGQRDCIPAVMELLGAQVLFHGVAMKPGGPLLVALYRGKLIFGLSGNPFAALATLELLALPALLKLAGRSDYLPRRGTAVLLEPFAKRSGGRRFLRGTLDAQGVRIPEKHASGTIESSRGCNCFVDIPPGSGALPRGTRVETVLLLGSGPSPCPAVPQVPVYAVSGFHKTGKTTVLEAAVAHLKTSGCRVFVVKHDGHGFTPDVPGTDSFRLKAAGADAVLVYSDELLELVEQAEAPGVEQMITRLLRQTPRAPDLVLVEGCKDSAYPKLLLQGGESREELQEKGLRLAEYLLREFIQKEKEARL